jgi:hypothetical protein
MFLKIINEHLAISSAMEYTSKKNPHPSDRYGPNRLIWLELSTGVAGPQIGFLPEGLYLHFS